MKKLNLSIAQATLLALSVAACGGGSSGSTPNSTEPTPQAPSSDTSPNNFTFTDIASAPIAAVITSNAITISGIDAETSITISGGEYAINNGSYTASSGNVNNGDSITVRLTTSSSYQAISSANLTIGGVSDSFDVTTLSEPQTPISGVALDFNINVKHQVGGLSTFDRPKFMTIHASHTENDWFNVGTNESDDLITEFIEGNDVYFGRDTGGMAWQLSQLQESTLKPGYVDANQATTNGNNTRNWYSSDNTERGQKQRQHEHRNQQMIVAAQQHPYWPDGKLTGQGWALSQTDTNTEPLGTATGDYMGQFLAKYFNRGGSDTLGQPKPVYVEVMNEPVWELVEFGEPPTTVEKVFEFHNTVADAIRNTEYNSEKPNENILIGGYTVAFPDFDKYDFQQWLDRDKKFIDMTAGNMDFLSIHLYDFPIIGGTKKLRSGSNMEATLDLLHAYSEHALGEPLPLVISEYGAQIHDMFNQPWTPTRDWHLIKGLNSQLMQFLERPDQIEMIIPFIPVKAEWGRLSDTVPYYHRLMRQKKEGEGETGEEWVYTEIIKFYQLWANINGERFESYSQDQDIQIDGYLNGDKAYLIINNLEAEATDVNLNLHGLGTSEITQVVSKHLYFDGTSPILAEQTSAELPSEFSLGADATVIFELQISSAVDQAATASETKYFDHSDLIDVTANQTASFTINNVTTAENGYAMLRLGIARAHGLSLMPTVSVNGTPISVPADYRGYDQYHNGKGRDNYYGVIEIPVDIAELQANNTIQVTFPDSGGHIASKGLQVITSTAPLGRTAE